MKKLLFAFAAVAVSLTACKKDETDDLTKNENPVITFTSLTGTTVEAGSTLSLVISVKSNDDGDKLKTVTLADSDGNAIVNPFVDINETSFDTTIVLTASTSFETTTYVVVAGDKKDNLASKSMSITTNDGFGADLTGSIFHIQGSLLGSYDLVNDAQVSDTQQPDSLKDIRNTDASGTFTGKWEAKSTTRFVISNFTDFDAITKTSAETEYAASVKNQIITPTVGGIYIAELRDGSTAVIKVTSINAANAECGCNALNYGKMEFIYKKM